MARYKLGVFSKKSEGRIIDLDKIIKLEKLENLDEFTCSFKSETELKIYLFNQGLITYEELNQNLNIRYKYNGKIKKLPIFYQDTKKYLDLINLRYELKKLSGNLEFLEKLANFYSNGSTSFNKQGLNVSDIRHYLSYVRNTGDEALYTELLEVAIEDLFKKAIFKEINTQTGQAVENYRGMRDLALFVIKFKRQEKKKQEKKELLELVGEQTSFFDESFVRKLRASVESIEENKWKLSSEGEPDFPYNSEEEREYQKYLENLPEEGHPHYRR